MKIIEPPYNLRIFNVEPDPIDRVQRKKYALKQIEIKEEVDLRDTDSNVDDQRYLGSCAANAIINTYENMILRSQPDAFKDLSRLFLYYNTRVLEERVLEDYGVMYLANAFESLRKQGVCAEELWPYDIPKFLIKPSDDCYEEALSRRIVSYEYVDSINEVKEILSSGKPLVIGMSVFSDFLAASNINFTISKPKNSDYKLGGHAVSLVGYTKDNHFIIKNSFGSDWGDNGYALLTEEYMEKYVFEKWYFSINEKGD